MCILTKMTQIHTIPEAVISKMITLHALCTNFHSYYSNTESGLRSEASGYINSGNIWRRHMEYVYPSNRPYSSKYFYNIVVVMVCPRQNGGAL